MIRLLTPLLLLLFPLSMFSQFAADCLDNQYIIQLQSQDQPEIFNQRTFAPLTQSCIHQGSNLYVLEFDPARLATEDIAKTLANTPEVIAFQKNCRASRRNGGTDDPLSMEQWSLERIGATELWSITQGGLTPSGDTIVVSVMDSGADVFHEDLVPNLWKNLGEIDNDGMDNDNNGYIDDVFGLNMQTLNDDHRPGFHGTAVAGIIGAKRDNELGIAGIAGDVKLMIFTDVVFMDRVLESLMYAYEQRKRYNESNGDRGAFVVSTNYSLGFDLLKCEDFPLFDLVYDSLGTVGILSVGATPNRNLNIDDVGDIPSSCGSDFLIAVTNTTEGDVKEISAGFGTTSIDLGAPGDDIITSFPNDDYKIFGGTSGATPHVTAAIALLYSVPCQGFQNLVKTDPEKAAREIKRFILEGVDPISSLENKTVSGGRLNVWNAFTRLAMEYGPSSDRFNIASVYPNPSDGLFKLDLELPEQGFYDTEIIAADGRIVDRFEIPGFCLDGPTEINLSHLKSGLYFLRILSEERAVLATVIIL